MTDFETITNIIELYRVDEFIALLILYYLFKIWNVAVIFMENLGKVLIGIYRGLKEDITGDV
jgi:hypothetical protein